MEKKYPIILDKDTLDFCIEIAWSYGFLCKQTKDGRSKAEAFNRVKSTIEHYKNMTDNPNVIVKNTNESEVI